MIETTTQATSTPIHDSKTCEICGTKKWQVRETWKTMVGFTYQGSPTGYPWIVIAPHGQMLLVKSWRYATFFVHYAANHRVSIFAHYKLPELRIS